MPSSGFHGYSQHGYLESPSVLSSLSLSNLALTLSCEPAASMLLEHGALILWSHWPFKALHLAVLPPHAVLKHRSHPLGACWNPPHTQGVRVCSGTGLSGLLAPCKLKNPELGRPLAMIWISCFPASVLMIVVSTRQYPCRHRRPRVKLTLPYQPLHLQVEWSPHSAPHNRLWNLIISEYTHSELINSEWNTYLRNQYFSKTLVACLRLID